MIQIGYGGMALQAVGIVWNDITKRELDDGIQSDAQS